MPAPAPPVADGKKLRPSLPRRAFSARRKQPELLHGLLRELGVSAG